MLLLIIIRSDLFFFSNYNLLIYLINMGEVFQFLKTAEHLYVFPENWRLNKNKKKLFYFIWFGQKSPNGSLIFIFLAVFCKYYFLLFYEVNQNLSTNKLRFIALENNTLLKYWKRSFNLINWQMYASLCIQLVDIKKNNIKKIFFLF